MQTILTPCQVPWAISPTTSGVTLTHSESDVEPECSVVLGAGRLTDDDRTDDRRIEITFNFCCFARVGPHSDDVGIEAIGYRIEPTYDGEMKEYLCWRSRQWRSSGTCPDSGFYVAQQSIWLASLPKFFQSDFRHYVIDGRDGYVELIARRYRWREWLWVDCHREKAPLNGPIVGSGEGIA